MIDNGLKDKTLKGLSWSAADAFLSQGVTFIVGLVLARILSPEEYGLIGIVTIFTTVMLGFVDCGFGNALIRKQNVNDTDYNTMFLVNMFMSVIMYVMLYIVSPFIAVFFERMQLTQILRIGGLLLIIQAFSIVQDTILKKRIDFKTKTKASFISACISGICGILMAFANCGVWSLVGQLIIRQLLYSICLWLFNRWTPSIRFSFASLKYMWNFGWKLMISGFLVRVWDQLYQIVVGKFYNPATLGQYTRANQLASIFSSNLTSIIQRVSFPVLSTIQDDKDRLVACYRKIIKVSMFITSVILFFMAATAEPLIYCLVGSQWDMAADFLPFICFTMVLYPLHAINLNMLQVQGRTDIFLYIEILKKILAIIPILLGIFVGIYWMLVGSIVFGIICFFINSYYSGKSLGYNSWTQLCDIAPSFVISLVVAISVYFIKYLPINFVVVLLLQILIGFGVFVAICEVFKNNEYIEIKNIVRHYIIDRIVKNYE